MSHRPRKRFGQHFLHDPLVIGRILRAVDPRPGQRLVEIGPGTGALTAGLLEAAGRLDVIEIDRDLAAALAARYAGHGGLRVHVGDALRLDLADLAGGERLRLVGNLPYNVSTPLLFRLLAQIRWIEDMHFMLQEEVVHRIAAAPGGGEYGRLSVMVQYHCRAEPLFHVGRGAFSPPPRVESAVLRLRPRPAPEPAAADPAALAEVVRRAFGQRRKTLRNALRGLADPALIAAAGLDPGARPETVDVAGFVRLANRVALGS